MSSAARGGYYRFWAKTCEGKEVSCHLLPYHNLDVAAVAQAVLEQDELLRGRLASMLGISGNRAARLIRALLALHDIGKFSERFQSLSPDVGERIGAPQTSKEYTIRHDTLGQVAWSSFAFSKLWEEGELGTGELPVGQWDWKDYLAVLMKPVTGHHGSPPDLSQRQAAKGHFQTESREALRDYARDALTLLMPEPALEIWEPSRIQDAKRASWMIAGLAVLSDWIGSNFDYFQPRIEETPLPRYWSQSALPQARAAIERVGILPPSPSEETGLQVLFPDFEPTPMQKYATEVPIGKGPELHILEDATGSGKTEAALTLGHRLMAEGKADGLYVGLPTMATANAMYERLARAYGRLYKRPGQASLSLAHSARDLSVPFRESIGIEPSEVGTEPSYSEAQGDRTATARCAEWLADSRKKSLLAHVGVGTIDQALLGALPSNHQSLRLLGLGQKVLVVDEVHAYDPYTERLLRQLLSFQAAQGGNAILLSATLPRQVRRRLVEAFQKGKGEERESAELSEGEFPLATRAVETVQEVAVNEKGSQYREGSQIREGYRREVSVRPFYKKERVVQKLTQVAKEGKCACWIRNTVPDARKAWKDLSEHFEGKKGLSADDVGLFHARFALADRQSIEKDVLEAFGKESGPAERAGKVLVATQVAEQSLDLDFDYMISDLSLIDLIIQRAGRMHRHARSPRGRRIEDGPDQRGPPELGVYGPPPVSDPDPDWYSRMFPRASHVYPDVGTLWLTAQTLQDRGRIKVPGEARRLIESVYGPEARDQVPEVLEEKSREAKEERRHDQSVASGNVLHVSGGYGSARDLGRWMEEETAPTRLGAPTTTVRLGKARDGDIHPWAEGPDPWRRSEVRVRSSKIDAPPRRGPERQAMVKGAEESMPDGGRWGTLIVLTKNDGKWTGSARNDEGETVDVRYSPTEGLQTAE